MSLVFYSNASDEPYACERSLVERCRPPLDILQECGLKHLKIMVRIQDEMELDSEVLHPRFFDAISVTDKRRKEIASATSAITRTIVNAIEAAVAEGHEEHEMPSSFFAYVTVRWCDKACDWSITCEVIAIVADDYPDVGFKLR